MDFIESEPLARLNDKLRKAMSLSQINLELSEIVTASPRRSEILKAVRTASIFDPEIDIAGDHSVGVVAVDGDVFVFRFKYEDDRYDYSKEVGKRSLTVCHWSEFKSVKVGKKVALSAQRILDEGAV